MTALLLAPKWWRAANGGSRKFGSFQPQPIQRELNWSTWMFFESPFFWYPSCLVYAHVVWWLTALWTARTTRRRGPGKWLTLWCITSVEMFFNLDVICCGAGGRRNFFLYFKHVGQPSGHVCWGSMTLWMAKTIWWRRLLGLVFCWVSCCFFNERGRVISCINIGHT